MATSSESLGDATGTLGQRCFIISVVPVGNTQQRSCPWPGAEALTSPTCSGSGGGDSSKGTPSWHLLGPPRGGGGEEQMTSYLGVALAKQALPPPTPRPLHGAHGCLSDGFPAARFLSWVTLSPSVWTYNFNFLNGAQVCMCHPHPVSSPQCASDHMSHP